MTAYDLLFLLVLFAVSLIQGGLGFGFGSIAMAVLVQFGDARALVPQVALAGLPVVGAMAFHLRGHVRLRRTLPLAVGVIIGTVLGVSVLTALGSGTIRHLVGWAVIVASVLGILRPGVMRALRGTWQAYPMGFLAGCLSVFNAPSPPLVHYVHAQTWSAEERKAVLQVVFILCSTLRVALFWTYGMYTRQIVWLPLVAIPMVVAGALFGHRFVRGVPQAAFTRVVYLFLLVLGLLLVVH